VVTNLGQRGERVAVVAGVAREALAQAGGVVALAAAAALEAVLVRGDALGGVAGVLAHTGLQAEAVQLGRAAGAALVALHLEEVLSALHGVAGEGHLDFHGLAVLSVARHGQPVDDSVGQVQQGEVDVVDQIRHVGVIEHDRDGGEGLVQAGGEGERKRAVVEVIGVQIGSLEVEGLHLILLGNKKSIADGEDVISVGAHALGAVNIAIGGVADTAASLACVPNVVVVGELSALDVGNGVVIPLRRVGHVLNVLAGSVARAIVGARGTLASLALVTIEAATFAGGSVANATASTLSVLVEDTGRIRSINPSQLERADAI
jgi:hypothetical protein